MHQRSLKEYAKVWFYGLCMGIADLIPGISGGTIAFVLGIYEELITALRSFDAQLWAHIKQKEWKAAVERVHLPFLACLFTGIATAVLTLAKLLHWLFVNQSVYLHAFFFGLILATVPLIARRISKWRASYLVLGLTAAALTYVMVGLVPISTPETAWFLFLSGALAICAMILPGISGAFILLLLGKYEFIVHAVSVRDVVPVAIVGLGVAAGLFSFVRLLHFLLSRYHDIIVAALTGLVVGSLRKIWPWKEIGRALVTEKGKMIPLEEVNVWPAVVNAEVGMAIVFCVLGVGVAWALHVISVKEPSESGLHSENVQ